MKILATTYAVNPYKGSEDGMGWNFILQIARFNQVIAVTRKNNKEHIDKYMLNNPKDEYKNITFLYYDLPYWMRFWKRGNKGAMIYYYLWQLFMPIFIWMNKLKFDIAHNVNFHNDWTPSFLWTLGKPMVWGPVGHHPFIKKEFIKQYGRKVVVKNQLTWLAKNIFWKLDPFLQVTKWKSKVIFSMNTEVADKLKGIEHKQVIMPSVSSEKQTINKVDKTGFNILSVGRLIPLKGFDLTIKAFNEFFSKLSALDQEHTTLTIVGSGSHENYYKKMVAKLGIQDHVKFISWIERSELANIYKEASLFLFPSHEGAGMVVSEALSYGLPVVSLDNCGPGEFINEHCGIKVSQDDYSNTINELSDAVKRIYMDIRLRDSLSIGAIEHFNNNFDWDNKGDVLNSVYKQVLNTNTSLDVSLFKSI